MGYHPQESPIFSPYKYHGAHTYVNGVHPSLSLETLGKLDHTEDRSRTFCLFPERRFSNCTKFITVSMTFFGQLKKKSHCDIVFFSECPVCTKKKSSWNVDGSFPIWNQHLHQQKHIPKLKEPALKWKNTGSIAKILFARTKND